MESNFKLKRNWEIYARKPKPLISSNWSSRFSHFQPFCLWQTFSLPTFPLWSSLVKSLKSRLCFTVFHYLDGLRWADAVGTVWNSLDSSRIVDRSSVCFRLEAQVWSEEIEQKIDFFKNVNTKPTLMEKALFPWDPPKVFYHLHTQRSYSGWAVLGLASLHTASARPTKRVHREPKWRHSLPGWVRAAGKESTGGMFSDDMLSEGDREVSSGTKALLNLSWEVNSNNSCLKLRKWLNQCRVLTYLVCTAFTCFLAFFTSTYCLREW